MEPGFKEPNHRFWSKVDLSEVGPWDCWEWLAYKDRDGYGTFTIPKTLTTPKTKIQAHRYAYLITYGPFTEPIIRHRCDNEGCVNPMHLIAGSYLDNQMDSVARGQWVQFVGVYPKAILSEEDVFAILSDNRKASVVAEDYGVSKGTIWGIRSGRSWNRVRLKFYESVREFEKGLV